MQLALIVVIVVVVIIIRIIEAVTRCTLIGVFVIICIGISLVSAIIISSTIIPIIVVRITIKHQSSVCHHHHHSHQHHPCNVHSMSTTPQFRVLNGLAPRGVLHERSFMSALPHCRQRAEDKPIDGARN